MKNAAYSQDTLFGDKLISSINYDEQEIIQDILHLHTINKVIDCDPTYSTGNFYKKGLRKPIHKFDKYPQMADVLQAESSCLPLNNESCDVIMFDPPFVIGTSENYELGSGVIGTRFTAFKDFNELKAMYTSSLIEFHRILKNGGIVIFKCQDVNSSSKQHFSHCYVMSEALRLGYYPKDLFILLARNRISDNRWKQQRHARKFHCYYWVLEKRESRVDYTSIIEN